MSKAIKMAKVSAKGGFSLFLGVALSTAISAIGTIFVARMLAPDEYGLVGIALVGPNLFVMFRSWGVDSAIIKHLAQFRPEGNEAGMKNVLVSGFVFKLVMGVLLSVFSFSLAGFLAVSVFHRPETNLNTLIEIFSITVFAGSLTKIFMHHCF